jgi:polygalacturonase
MSFTGMWMQHYLACDDMLISGIKVYNHCNKNNDMIDIDGCRNVVITGCLGDTDDDALTLKSTSPRACENITISNCVLSSHCNAIKMGTESTGGFRNISITGCVVKPSSDRQVIYGLPDGISGISLEVVDGGVMEGIVVSDIVIDGPEVPLFVRLGNRARPYKKETEIPAVGSMSDIIIQNVVAINSGKTGCSITGIPGHPIRNITLSNLTMQMKGGIEAGEYHTEVPELETLYPESTMFGVLPASAFYLRHLENIDISGLNVNFSEPDERETIISEDVRGLTYKEK